MASPEPPPPPEPAPPPAAPTPDLPGTVHPRRRRRIDWELVACGFRGHVLVARDAETIRPEDAPLAREIDGTRWHRCLRCDAWVAAAAITPARRPHPPGPGEITVPLRGRPLRDRIVLRLIAVDRVVHFFALGLLGVAVLLFTAHRTSLQHAFYRVLTALQGGVGGGPVQTTGHVGIVHELDRLFTLRTGTLTTVGFALLAYAALEGVEAVGLWRGRRWAEYLTFVATAVLLPLEIYELSNRATALKVIGFIINLAVVIYLLFHKRLFGLRGGGRAEAAIRARELSWERIQQSTPAFGDAGEPGEVRA